mgnify:CR=1 FL=1
MEHETLNDALIDAIKAIGGSKVVAAMLWPAKAARNIDDARRYLAACLDPERAEKLSLDEILLVMREARARGCHAPMRFLAQYLSYAEPLPVEPRDELSDLLRQDLEANRETQRRQERIERLLQGLEKRPTVRSA